MEREVWASLLLIVSGEKKGECEEVVGGTNLGLTAVQIVEDEHEVGVDVGNFFDALDSPQEVCTFIRGKLTLLAP